MTDKPITDKEIADGLRVCEAATKGPWWLLRTECRQDWERKDSDIVPAAFLEGPHYWPDPEVTYWKVEDAEFVEAARTLLPRVLAELQRVRGLEKEWRERDDGLYGQVWTLAADEVEGRTR